jgi:hypothetical protein
MKKSLFIIVFICFVSCKQNNEVIKGELWFKLINLMPNEGFSNDRTVIIEKSLDTLDIDKVKNNDLKELYKSLILLRKHKLLNSPNIGIKINKDEYRTVHLDKKEYEKIKKYSLDYLNKSHIKIEIELKVQELEKNLYYSDQIINLKEISGKTYFSK